MTILKRMEQAVLDAWKALYEVNPGPARETARLEYARLYKAYKTQLEIMKG